MNYVSRDMQGTMAMYDAAIKGNHKFMLGSNQTLFDFTYVDNIAYAHLIAAQRMEIGNKISGQVKYETD